MQKKHIQRN